MKRNTIIIITILVCFSLIGVITFQVIWIKDTIKVKDEQIGYGVNNALQTVIKKLEVHDKLSKIVTTDNHNVDVIIFQDSINIYTAVHPEDSNSVTIIDDGKTIINYNRVIHQYGSGHTEANNIDSGIVINQQFLNNLISDYQRKNLPLYQKLNLAEIDSLIIKELSNNRISTKFEYAIIDKNNEVIFPDIEFYKKKLFIESRHKANLFPTDVFSENDQLVIYFPKYQSLLFSTLISSLLYSSLFTILLLITLGSTLYVIFKQKKVDEIKTDFINNMTHEFKTPIATIGLAIDSLENPKVFKKEDQIFFYTDIIRKENKRMNTQVERVLQMALIDKKELKLNPELININDVIQRACDNIILQVKNNNGELNTYLDERIENIYADQSLCLNVVLNLLDNAIKYSPNTLSIDIISKNVSNGVEFEIKDLGIGMSHEVKDKIFDKFYRLPTGNIHNIKGFGLGLSYVKAIILAHQGNITVISKPGQGSTFKIFLPNNF